MLVDVGLPLSLAIIMFSLGLGLTFADFGRVLSMPRAVVTGMVMQMAALPLVAFALLVAFDMPPAIAFGVMLLAFCPGGISSSILTRLGGGNVALSITLTGVVSLFSAFTVPFLTAWAAARFLGTAAPELNVTGIAMVMFALTFVPVMIGVLFRFVAPEIADRIDGGVFKLATVLFILVVVGALASNWALFMDNIARLGPLLMLLNLVLLVLGVLVSKLLGLTGGDALCISVEMGVQNAALGITVAGLVAHSAGISEFAVPAGVYGITMYVVTLPGIWVMRRMFHLNGTASA
ncbi:bile acid:sodium symporter [Alisedimentitalea sp. MJ-SS2]|uniref:bile acid:sodium symporter family protein n=1 Tax=Aliisedimentitalea sp. MJ-SS2 TaxID=3049795 RepID=UPI00290863BF|nr:bile acid:sodium symporter [Alisedimentitalea sp. MJ-SS2]MDU8925988.1 bile acid:sodium symporter [Alisedimentitalea sp. MJ-SS2]